MKSPSLKVLVIDDEENATRDHAKKIKKGMPKAEVFHAHGDNLVKLVEDLRDLQTQARSGNLTEKKEISVGGKSLNDYDVLVIDNDLFLAESSVRSGGELAYLARCYSRIPYIVLINESDVADFDLTLTGKPHCFADANIPAQHIANPGLWSLDWKGYFRPWYWPVVTNEVKAVKSCWRELKKAAHGVNSPVLEFFGLHESALLSFISQEALEFLVGKCEKSVEEITFRDFVESSGNALEAKDRVADDDAIIRIAVARTRKWLDCFVLRAEELLVDSAHLVLRCPNLLKKNQKANEFWSEGFSKSCPKLDEKRLAHFGFDHPNWLTRKAWLWPLIRDSEIPAEVDWNEYPELLFAEDVSRFLKPASCRRFKIGVRSAFNYRSILDRNSKDVSKAQKDELKELRYAPEVRLTL